MRISKKIFGIILAVALIILPAGCSGQPLIDNTPALNYNANNENLNLNENESEESPQDNNDEIVVDSADSPETNADAEEDRVKKDGFVFKYDGKIIYLDDYIENALKILGEPKNYEESDSCTSEGIMVVYYYNGFEVSGYVINEADRPRIYSIFFKDDSVSTAEGIYIGHAIEEMFAAYGTDYEELDAHNYKYVKNGTQLSFYMEDGIISTILYQIVDENN